MTHIDTTKKAGVVFGIVTVLAFLLPVLKSQVDVGNLLAATSVFYSVLLGFYIASSMTNLSRLKSLVAMETGALISVYHLAKLALPNKVDVVRTSIDTYLIKRFEYEIEDYIEPTNKEFFAIFDVLKHANPGSTGQGAAVHYIAEAHYYISQARREISVVGARVVSTASWVILYVLSGLIVFSLFLMRDGTFASTVVTILLSASAIIVLFILRDVDGNKFGEEEFAINSYQAVFKALELDPYYPEEFITTKRHTPKETRYRTGSSQHVRLVNKS